MHWLSSCAVSGVCAVCEHMCIVCICTHARVHACTCAHTCMRESACACAHVYVHMYAHMYVHTCMHARARVQAHAVQVPVCVCMCVCVYACVHVCVCVWACAHVYTRAREIACAVRRSVENIVLRKKKTHVSMGLYNHYSCNRLRLCRPVPSCAHHQALRPMSCSTTA